MQTNDMIDSQHLDIRTITMGISLRDCCDPDINKCCKKIYDKIVSYAQNLVSVAQEIELELGIPIVNKRISVTPVSIIAESCETDDYVPIAKALDEAAKKCGVIHERRQESYRLYPRSAQADRTRLRKRQRCLNEGGNQHGRRKTDG